MRLLKLKACHEISGYNYEQLYCLTLRLRNMTHVPEEGIVTAIVGPTCHDKGLVTG